MIRSLVGGVLGASLALLACDPAADPVSPERPLPAPLRVEAPLTPTTYFAITTLPGRLSAGDLTNAGEVVGVAWNEAGTARTSDFYWAPGDAAVTQIPNVPVPGILFGVSANNAGVVVGTTADCDQPIFTHCAYAWSVSDGRRDLYPLSDHRRSNSVDVNDAGLVVGRSTRDDGTVTATVWRLPLGSVTEIVPSPPPPAAPYNSEARAVNEAGVVVGGVRMEAPVYVPFQWTESGGFQVLSALHAAVEAVAAASGRTVRAVNPNAINESGQIAGFWSSVEPGGRNAFFWDPAGGLTDLNALGGFTDAVPSDVNESGQTTVVVFLAGGGSEAWVWSAADGFVELPALVPGAAVPSAIDDASRIVGGGGDLQAVIWTPLEDAEDVLDALDDALDDVLTTSPAAGGQGLEAKLDRIREHLAAGRANAARNQLGAFLNQVAAMEAEGRLSPEDAGRLRAAAEALLALLPGS